MPSGAESKTAKPVQSKTAFVLSQSSSMPAKEVAEKAKKAGMVISDKYVYVVRSNARRKGRAKRGRPALVPLAPTTPSEREFRRLALELGVRKAEALLSDTKKKVAALIVS